MATVTCHWQGAGNRWRRVWLVPDLGGDTFAVQRADLRPEERPLDAAAVRGIIERWTGAFELRGDVVSLFALLGAEPPSNYAAVDSVDLYRSLRDRVRNAFNSGELVLVRFVRPKAAHAELAPASSAPPTEKEAPNESKVKTWVEVRLVDMDGNPVANKRYWIKVPGGTVEEGFLDGSGRVRISGIEPGQCAITFPDLDQDAWERV